MCARPGDDVSKLRQARRLTQSAMRGRQRTRHTMHMQVYTGCECGQLVLVRAMKFKWP